MESLGLLFTFYFSIFSYINLVPSGPPLNLKAFPVTPTIIIAEWDVPNVYFQNGILKKFTLRYSSVDIDIHNEVERIIPVNDNSTSFSFTISNLLEAVNYSIDVSASTIEGMGPYSESVYITTFHTGTLVTVSTNNCILSLTSKYIICICIRSIKVSS